MCCGPTDRTDPVAQPYVAPKPAVAAAPTLDPTFLNVQVKSGVKWTDQAEAAGLKVVELGIEHFSVAPSPNKYFKVIVDGKALLFEKAAVLDVAKKVLVGSTEKDDDKINNLCQMLSTQAGNAASFPEGMASLQLKRTAYLQTASEQGFTRALHEKTGLGDLEVFKLTLKPDVITQLEPVLVAIAGYQKELAGTPLSAATVDKHLATLKLYENKLIEFERLLPGNPMVENSSKILSPLRSEIVALVNYVEAPAAARLQEIGKIDAALAQLSAQVDKEYASKTKEGTPNGNPGISLFKANNLLVERDKLVGELRSLSVPEPHIKLLELKVQGHAKKFGEAIQKMTGHLTGPQLEMLEELKAGKVKTHNTLLGLKTTKRSDAEIAAEIRPIITTMLSRALVLKDFAGIQNSKALIDKLSVFGDRKIWIEVFRPPEGFDLEMHKMFEAYKATYK